jgi:hypothetical protein
VKVASEFDPTGAATGLACGENGSTSDTGDLRNLLPTFVTGAHMTILEIYNQDALLAYDPAFCTPSGASCSSASGTCTGTSGDLFSTLDLGHQSQFFECVGQGTSCGGSAGTGDCSYATAITGTRGTH